MWPQALCVTYVVAVLAALFGLHVRFARAGGMCFDTIHWVHIAHGTSGRGPVPMALYRLLIAIFVCTTDIVITTAPNPGARLSGARVLATFSIWCWTFIGVYFALTGAVSMLAAAGVVKTAGTVGRHTRMFCSVVWVWFEVMFSCAILVCLVVWLVLIPYATRYVHNPPKFFNFLNLSVHNLNVVFMIIEALLNRLSFVGQHFVFIVYYGIVYLVFSWFYFLYTGIFFYFFIDWRAFSAPVGYTLLLGTLYGSFFIGRQLVDRLKRSSAAELPGPLGRDSLRAPAVQAEGREHFTVPGGETSDVGTSSPPPARVM